jgi:hypothetical protein
MKHFVYPAFFAMVYEIVILIAHFTFRIQYPYAFFNVISGIEGCLVVPFLVFSGAVLVLLLLGLAISVLVIRTREMIKAIIDQEKKIRY